MGRIWGEASPLFSGWVLEQDAVKQRVASPALRVPTSTESGVCSTGSGVQRLVCCMHSVSFGQLLSRRCRRMHPDAPGQILPAALRMVTFCCAASIVSLAPSPNRDCDVVSYYTRF
jgi:hypothetical protein